MNVDSLTHGQCARYPRFLLFILTVNFAFAYISDTYEVIEMTSGDSAIWTETTALKSRNPSLKVFLSIGGWTFNNPVSTVTSDDRTIAHFTNQAHSQPRVFLALWQPVLPTPMYSSRVF